ncbi:D-3-phosphoglycerate dehydrogenase [Histoplasma capsulatum H143]|uniref:2-oxoglutarate reductase n=1 Tax=Ajellomyces capsulatus (strain H143) TaxID=544712 RepID=C6HG97_AJECH|nr:D-3-phosphoglycerate dehydrogenase [Histoplasma capsulatum H143]
MASAARDIKRSPGGHARSVSRSFSFSTSPSAAVYSSPSSQTGMHAANPAALKPLKPFATEDIKILLLENVNPDRKGYLQEQGYQVEPLQPCYIHPHRTRTAPHNWKNSSKTDPEISPSLSRDVHVIGIRSKTKLTERVLKEARNLIVIGCFCIGTNQVDLQYAATHGMAVFNSPFSNSRSVAELVIGEIISLARQLCDRSSEMHNGMWNKVSSKCWEVRGKTLGIVGYGHIGSQLSVLADAMGMNVIYYDVVNLMAMGTARQVPTLRDLLSEADFVTLHVPELPETKNMISAEQLRQMKYGSYLINASRGSVVDIPALIQAMREGKIAELRLMSTPTSLRLNRWSADLRALKNLILTPHIGGSTEEAQSAIGIEVAQALVRYVNEGVTIGAVNMPEVHLRSLTMEEPNHGRVIFIHQNIPGVLRKVNEILSDHNVDKQMTDSRGDVAYLMADISDVHTSDIKDLYNRLENLPSRIMTRILY